MRRFWHKFFLVAVDITMLNMTLLFTYIVRFHSGLFSSTQVLPLGYYFISGVWLLLTTFFILLFALNGLYSLRWDVSRFDQVLKVSRVIIIGALFMFLITLDPEHLFSATRWNLIIYAGLLIVLINLGRLILIYFEKLFVVLEYAPHNTLVVGYGTKAKKIIDTIQNNRHLLFRIIGIVDRKKPEKQIDGIPYLGKYDKIPDLIRDKRVAEVIIALEEQSPDEILNIVAYGENLRVAFKVIPELYDVISGLKTEEVIGHPLLKLFPDHMRPWQWLAKRGMDILLALFLLILLSPLWAGISFALLVFGVEKVLTIENRVGKDGMIFGLVRFFRRDKESGVCRFLSGTGLFRLPELLNVLLGNLAFVGPRPETDKIIKNMRKISRFYGRRLMIRPGMTGWAQLNLPKLRFNNERMDQMKHDLFYLENMSLSFDFRILIRSLMKYIFR